MVFISRHLNGFHVKSKRCQRIRHDHHMAEHELINHSPIHRGRRERERMGGQIRSEEHTSELQSLMRISYAVFCLKKKNKKTRKNYAIDIYNINILIKNTTRTKHTS